MSLMLSNEMYNALKSAGAGEQEAQEANQVILALDRDLNGLNYHLTELRAETKTAFFCTGIVFAIFALLFAALSITYFKKFHNLLGA